MENKDNRSPSCCATQAKSRGGSFLNYASFFLVGFTAALLYKLLF